MVSAEVRISRHSERGKKVAPLLHARRAATRKALDCRGLQPLDRSCRYWRGRAFNAVASKVGFQGHVLGLRPSKEAYDRLVAASSSFDGKEEAFIASSMKQDWEAVPEDQRFSKTALLVSSSCNSRGEAWTPLTAAGDPKP